MEKLNRDLLKTVKQAFVPQPGGAGEPVAGASPMTAAMGAPMGGDPSMAGGAPMDPSMAGGAMPPMGMDPAMAGMIGGGGAAPAAGGMTGSSTLTLSVDDLIKLFKVFQRNSGGGAEAAPAQPAAAAPSATDQKLDQVIELLKGALGG